MSKQKQPVLSYFESLHAVRGTGKATAEQSYKSKLEALLTALGKDFDPELHAAMELKSEGAGRPDLGIFEKKSGNLRLVVEVKGPKDNIYDITSGAQVSKYGKRYGFVLVTNFREFVLVARDAQSGEPGVEARYQISASAEAFEKANPTALAKEHEQGLTDFLQGVFARPSPIVKPKDLAADLARHAREAKRRLNWHSAEALRPLQEACEIALGLTFEDDKGLDFFRSSLVQTLFYGLFSGWMLWRQSVPKGKSPPKFHWKDASDFLALPLIGDLFDEVARPRRLTELDLREPLEWAAASLNRVDHDEFFNSFDADHAITLFYEPFLAAFDPTLRKELGVWYTPPEIVKYMVGRVDQLLRSELGIADGLADESVYVLDPATGTGSYLVEVAKRIYQNYEAMGYGGLVAAYVKRALTTRVFGFEILPAPYVIAHLQLDVLLKSMGVGLAKNETAGVFLTNALTGWEPPKGAKQSLAFPFLQDEQDKAAKIKREAPIIVILGNPPYNAFAGVAQQEEANLIEPYKRGLYEEWGVGKQLLDDLYVRFFRLAERRITKIGGRGIVCYISNFGWMDGLSHVVMRDHLLSRFDGVWIDNCNGDRFRTGKRTPEGKPDQSMFTTDDQAIGIEPGTAIATFVRSSAEIAKNDRATVRYRELWGYSNDKRRMLLDSLSDKPPKSVPKYKTAKIARELRYAIGGHDATAAYLSWPNLADLMGEPFKGVQPGRGTALVDTDRDRLERRMRLYFDRNATEAVVAAECADLMTDEARYDASGIRRELLKKKESFHADRLIPIVWLPFDERSLYWQPNTKLLNEKRVHFKRQVRPGNLFLACTQKPRKDEYPSPLPVDTLGSYYLIDPTASFFPLLRHEDSLIGEPVSPGMDARVLEALCVVYGVNPFESDGHAWTTSALGVGESLFYHVMAVLWSAQYKREHAPSLKMDWARVPIPSDFAVLESSETLGRLLSNLLLTNRAVPGVHSGNLRAELKALALHDKVGDEPIDPDIDLYVTASWGSRSKSGAVMPGQGKATPNEIDPDHALDIWINDAVYWRNVPRPVWEMTIGGYPVVKKWLSYRDRRVLGRALKMDEVVYVTQMVRRLAAVLALTDELDANYAACAKNAITPAP